MSVILVGVSQFCQRQNQARQHQSEHQQRYQHQPVEKHVPGYRRNQRPRIDREQAELGRQITVVLAQVAYRIGASWRWRWSRGVQIGNNGRQAVSSLLPCCEPASDIATAGDGGKIIKLFEDSVVRQSLDHP